MSEAEEPAGIDQLDAIQDVERLLLEAANAIQRLIAERDALRRRVDTLESELARLRERTTLVHDSYRRLATEFVTQLQLLDSGAVTCCESLFNQRACARRNNRLRRRRLPTRHPAHNSPRSASSIPILRHEWTVR
jgi:phage shock protein A